MSYIIIGNFGNHSLAALQYLLNQNIKPLHFLYVDTGWSSIDWGSRVKACKQYALEHGVTVHHIHAKQDFATMIRDRQQFPSLKFQWCAAFLKGLSIIEFLDEFDLGCDALIVSGKRRADSRRFYQLPEFQEQSEHYQGRSIWHPLYQLDDQQFQQVIAQTPFKMLLHAAQECSPCIHEQNCSIKALHDKDRKKVQLLEEEINQTLFDYSIQEMRHRDTKCSASERVKAWDRGCGAIWGCGE